MLQLLQRNPVRGRGPVLQSFVFSCLLSSSSRRLKSPDEPDAVLPFFRRYGFSDSQIKGIVHKEPWIASAKLEKTIKPKLDYFLAFGCSSAELSKLVSSSPQFLSASLQKRIIPNLNLLEMLFRSREQAKIAISRHSQLFMFDLEKNLPPNLEILKEQGFPAEKTPLLVKFPRLTTAQPKHLAECGNKLKELGVDPLLTSSLFLCGINVMLWTSPSTWERKLVLYESFGWSEKDTLSAFAKQPTIMCSSDDKIKKVMGFFLEKLGWESQLVSLRPKVLTYSLEKRIIPRCAILNLLASKGLWFQIPPVYSVLVMPERKFKDNFVDKYVEQVPSVFEAYQGKMEFVGFDQGKTRRGRSKGKLKTSNSWI